MNNKIRKIAILQSICLSIIASGTAGVFAADFNDTKDHWASPAIDIWSGHEVIHGYEGLFRPDDTMTRGELAVMLDRIMAYADKAENTYQDLGDTWYTDAVLKLAASGIMQGYESEMRPEEPVTREEVVVMLARALEIAFNDEEAPAFEDADGISEWAAEAVYALADKGYVNGFEDKTFRPQDNMSRAEFVTVVNNAVKGFYNKPGTYTSDEKLSGIVIVSSGDVVLENMEIEGDLILTPGVGDGVVTLKNTTVSGEIITQGGSVYEEDGDGGSDTDATPAPTSAPGGGSGGSGGSSGGSSGGGGGSSVTTAAETSIVVNKSYEGKTGTVVSNRKRYTIGKNAFSTLRDAVEKAGQLEKAAQITLLSNVTADETIEITSADLTLDGGKYTVEFAEGVKDGIQVINVQGVSIKNLNVKLKDEEGKWNGSYGIQAYGAGLKISNSSVTGADAAVLVNGAEVALDGVVDVSGNEFGGIEVSKGAGVESMPKLTGDASNLRNDTEAESNPTVWIDKVSELTDAAVEVTGLTQIEKTEKDQMYYYLSVQNSGAAAEVSDQKELEEALADEDIKVINISGSIAVDKTLQITRPLSIEGSSEDAAIVYSNTDGIEIVNAGNVTLEGVRIEITDDEEGWQGLYGVQAYGDSKVILRDVAVTGADAGILINGAEAELDGVVDVSGNEFGGIEVSKGADVMSMPKLTGDASNLRNDAESAANPTVWIDKVSELTSAVVEVSGLDRVDKSEKDQEYYFVNGIPSSMQAQASNTEELSSALLDPEIKVVTITGEIAADEALSVDRSIVIKGQSAARTAGAGLKFDNTDGIEIVNAGNVTLEDIKIEVINNEEGWQGLYGVQAYGASNVKFNNVTVTGADGGILVNGAKAELDGVVDVSGNEFGGIEVSKGAEAETAPLLRGTAENLKNDTETETEPTVWIDKVSVLTESVVDVPGLNKAEKAEKDQMHYFLMEVKDESSAEVTDIAELEAALADSRIKTINVAGEIAADKTLTVSRAVTVIGAEGASVTFDNTDGFEIVDAGEVTFENIDIKVENNEEGWQGIYGIQAYGASKAVFKDISVTGADAGILVNGAEAALEGVVDVSGNEFGGIEVSKGAAAETSPKLTASAAALRNESESAVNPTIWIDKVSELTEAVVEAADMHSYKPEEKDQLYFFINETAE